MISGRRHRHGQHDPSRVDSLKDSGEIDAAGDFLNQDRGQSLRSQLLVDAEEIDFRHFGRLRANGNRSGYALMNATSFWLFEG